MNDTSQQVLAYGGGRQTFATLELIRRGVLPRPDRIIISNTGREKSSTWEHLEEVAQPLAQSFGMTIEIAPHSLAYVDLYGHNGDLLIPVYTPTGKLSAFCSNEWKQRVSERYIKLTAAGHDLAAIEAMPPAQRRDLIKTLPMPAVTSWIGFALDERDRVKSTVGRRFPLLELSLTKRDCIQIIKDAGFPLPPPSSCYMCANMNNEEWRGVRDNYPDDFEQACQIDENAREEDIARGNGGVWLHHSRVPLREADLDAEDRKEVSRQCGLGVCFV